MHRPHWWLIIMLVLLAIFLIGVGITHGILRCAELNDELDGLPMSTDRRTSPGEPLRLKA
jgi:hypothetical protein